MTTVAVCLEGLAFAAGRRGRTTVSIRLHRCGHYLLAETDERYEQPLAPRLNDLIAQLHSEVGPEAVARLRTDGQALSVQEAIQLAKVDG